MKFNKSMLSASIGFAAALVLMLIIAVLFITPDTGMFWVSALFLFLAYLAIYATVMFYLYQGKKAFMEFPHNYALIHIAIWYAIIQVILVVAVVIFNHVSGSDLKMRYYWGLELILLLVFGVRYAVYNSGRKYTVNLERTTKAKVVSIRMLADKCMQIEQMVPTLPAVVQPETKALLHSLTEKVRYSDPMVPEAVAPMDYDIERLINTVAAEVQRIGNYQVQDLGQLRDMIHQAVSLIDTRNNRVRMYK